MSEATNQMRTSGQLETDLFRDEPAHQSDAMLIAEIVACLVKYQVRYCHAPHAKALWLRSDRALKAFAQTNMPADAEAHRIKAEDTPA